MQNYFANEFYLGGRRGRGCGRGRLGLLVCEDLQKGHEPLGLPRRLPRAAHQRGVPQRAIAPAVGQATHDRQARGRPGLRQLGVLAPGGVGLRPRRGCPRRAAGPTTRPAHGVFPGGRLARGNGPIVSGRSRPGMGGPSQSRVHSHVAVPEDVAILVHL